jgi:hypothetical protein
LAGLGVSVGGQQSSGVGPRLLRRVSTGQAGGPDIRRITAHNADYLRLSTI